MARRRRKQDNSLGAGLGILFLLFLYLAGEAESRPLLVSLAAGGAAAGLVAGLLLGQRRRRRRRAELVLRRQFYQLSPTRFEHAVAELFRQRGYHAKVTGQAGDRGIDILLRKNGQTGAVQCKRYRKKIGPAPVREFVGALEGAGVDEGYFVTTSSYTSGARDAAHRSSYRVRLIGGRQLGAWQNAARQTMNTDLIPAAWWHELARWQKALLVGFVLLDIVVVVGAVIYLGIG